jgi:hypothetical protein
MRHEIIKTDNYLLVLDYKDVQPGDSFFLNFDHPSGRIRRCYRVCDDGKEDLLMIDPDGFGFSYRRDCKRISAHLPLNGAPYLDGADRLPPMDNGEDVEQLAKLKYPIIMSPNGRTLAGGHYDIDVNFSERSAYKHGYSKAREKYKFTEEDVFGFLTYYNSINFNKPEYRYKHPSMDGSEREYNRSIDRKILAEYIQSLCQPKLPIAFESVDVDLHQDTGVYLKKVGTEPHKITNAQGRTEWAGEYIYE